MTGKKRVLDLPSSPTEAGGEPKKKQPRRNKSDAKIQRDLTHDQSNVPMKLKTLLRPFYRNEIARLIDDCAYNMSRIRFEAWILADMHVLRMMQEGKELPKMNSSFFKSCCVNVSQTKRGGGDEELRETTEVYKTLRPASWQVSENKAMSQLMSQSAIEMETAFENSVTLNVISRLKRYVRIKYNLHAKQALPFILSTFRDADNMLTWDQREFKDWLGINPLDENTRKNIPYFLRKMYEILTYYDTLAPDTKGKRGFTLLPKKDGFKTAFIHLDEFALPEILTRLDVSIQQEMIQTLLSQVGPEESEERAYLERYASSGFIQRFCSNRPEMSRALWNLVFDVPKLETCTRKFNYRVGTNGYEVHSSLQKPKKETEGVPESEIDFSPYMSFIGLDPGETYAAITFDGEVNEATGKSRCIQVSTKQIRHESRFTDERKWECRLRKKYLGYQSMLSELPSLKTANFQLYTERVKKKLENATYLFEFCRTHGYRRQRFNKMRRGKKAIHHAAMKILDGKDPKKTVIGFGDYSRRDGFIKGLDPAPVKKLRKELQRKGVKIVMIDEYRTSVCCSKCGASKTSNVSYFKKKKGKHVKCHQVIRCRNNDCLTYWQRDVNGSRNIYSLLMALVRREERPPALRRGSQFNPATGKLNMQ